MYVHENRKDLLSRLIDIPVRIFRTSADNPEEPIFYLNGGPGVSNLTFRPFEKFLKTRDVVLVGYRGVNGSSKLVCPGMFEAPKGMELFSDDAMTIMRQKIKELCLRP